MRCLIRTLAVLAAILLATILIVYLATPRDVRIERSIKIAAPPEVIFPKVNRLKAWRSWSPWILREPDMKTTYLGPEAGVGARTEWESDTQGSGTQVITESVTNERIVTSLDFGDMGRATSDWTFTPEENGTVVTWGLVSHSGNNLIFRIFGLFLDGMLGPDYESGLENLKKEVESGA